MTIFCGLDLDRIPISNLPGLMGMTIRGPRFDPIRSDVFFSKGCIVKDKDKNNYG
jgi:hypothetical protein